LVPGRAADSLARFWKRSEAGSLVGVPYPGERWPLTCGLRKMADCDLQNN